MTQHHFLTASLSVNRANLIVGPGLLSNILIVPAFGLAESYRFHGNKSLAGHDLSISEVKVALRMEKSNPFMEEMENQNGYIERSLNRTSGASRFDYDDLSSRAGKARNGTKTPTYGDQALALTHLECSLIVEVAVDGKSDGLSELLLSIWHQFLHQRARLAGGDIVRLEKPGIYKSFIEAAQSLPPYGYFVTDRTFEVERSEGRALAMMRSVIERKNVLDSPDDEEGDQTGKEESKKEHWKLPEHRSMTHLGYRLITPPEQKPGARNNWPHAYAEPMVGIVGLVKSREALNGKDGQMELTLKQNFLWQKAWPSPEYFLLHNSKNTLPTINN